MVILVPVFSPLNLLLMKRITTLPMIFVLSALFALQLPAQTFDEGNFRYTIVSESEKTVSIAQSEVHLSGNIEIPSAVKYNGVDYQVIGLSDFAFAYCSDITSASLPNGIESFGKYSFWECTSLKTVNIPSGVETIGPGSFWLCSKLQEVNLPANLKILEENLFYSCSSLRNIVIPDGVEEIKDFAFKDCSLLETDKMPSSLKSIGESAFFGTSITSAILPEGVLSVGPMAFSGCVYLSEIYIPATLSEFYGSALAGCEALESIEVSVDNKNYSSIDGVLFNKDQTELIIYPGKHGSKYEVPSSVVTVADGAFEKCASITEVVFNEGVETIGKRVFFGCNELKTVVLPSSVKSIGYGFLYDTNMMESFECRAVNPPVCDDNCFYGMFMESCKLKVSVQSVEDYSSSREWRKFNDIEGCVYTSLDNVSVTEPLIIAEDGCIILYNLVDGMYVNVYGLSGKLLDRVCATGNTVRLEPGEDVVIVEYGNYRLKVILD